MTVTSSLVDLDVDTDRDSEVDSFDDEAEDEFTKERGAVVLVNSDNDEGTNPDNEDTVVQGGDDVKDLSELVVHQIPLSKLEGEIRAILRIKTTDAQRMRIFGGKAKAAEEILGPTEGEEEGNYKYVVVNPEAGPLTLGVEALKYPYWKDADDNFDGRLEISLVLQEKDGANWVDMPWQKDTVALQVAPFVLASNGSTVEQVYLTVWRGDKAPKEYYEDFYNELTTVVNQLLGAGNFSNLGKDNRHYKRKVGHSHPGQNDYWVQDWMEFGNAQLRQGARMSVLLDLPRVGPQNSEADDAPVDLRKSDGSLGYTRSDTLSPSEGGNIEATPPYGIYPVGRVIMGTSGLVPELKKFFEQQKVHGLVATVDTDWLETGHVDEVFCLVKRGNSFEALVPGPSKACDILENLMIEGHGQLPFRKGADAVTVEDALVWDTAWGHSHGTLTDGIDSTTEQTFKVTAANFKVFCYINMIIKVGTERMKITGFDEAKKELTVDRGVEETTPVVHPQGRFVYSESNIVRWNRKVHQPKIDELVQDLRTDLQIQFAVRQLPVLFQQQPAGARAYTPNLVNSMVIGKNIIMARPHGPKVKATDAYDKFQEEVIRVLGSDYTPHFVEAWFLHKQKGTIHCTMHTKRAANPRMWWEAWPE